MSSELLSFHYQRLNHKAREFRLLKLLPYSSFEDDVCCEIFHSSLDDHPPYEALSYVWGDPSITGQIQCNGAACSVTANSAIALRYLRLRDRERIIWVDAICINQKDDSEKTHQVGQMRGVYTGAEQVVVWLGEEHEPQTQQILPISLACCRSFKVRQRNSMSAAGEQEVSKSCYDLFVSRPWWTRTWILQEVIHDRPVIACVGFLDFDFDDLCKMYSWYFLSKHFAQQPDRHHVTKPQPELLLPSHPHAKYSSLFAAAAATKRGGSMIKFARNGRKQGLPEEPSLLWLLQSTRAQKCSDPRDKIFAVLGMTSPLLAPLINYAASKREIYISVMMLFLQYKVFSSFLLVESPDRPISAITPDVLPSWVPDWTTDQSLCARSIFMASTVSAISTAENKPSNEFWMRKEGGFTVEEDILILSGVYVGAVTRVFTSNLEYSWEEASHTTMRLFQYDQNANGGDNSIPKDLHNQSGNMYNTSWGPFWVESGDIIIISGVCPTPMVIRRDGDSYLFVGGCWLIDEELQGPEESIDEELVVEELIKDPGTSSIMRISAAWDDAKVETFRIK